MPTQLESVRAPAGAHAAATHCPNCDAAVDGKFCAACGESTKVHAPSAAEFIHEFIGHYVALEGKLGTTLKLLLLQPGRLTVEFLRGRRVSLINPLRLYLTWSLIMFALIKLYGIELPKLTLDDKSVGASYSHTMLTRGPSGKFPVGTLSLRFFDDAAGPDKDELAVSDLIRQATATLGHINQKWMRNLQHFVAQPAAHQGKLLNHGFLANLPYMLIAAMPLFALYLKLIYRRPALHTKGYYGEHLVFALHANAFAFLLTSVMIVMPGSALWLVLTLNDGLYNLISVWDWLQLLPLVWLVAYLPVAMHRVYGGTRLGTAWRWLLLLTAHLLMLCLLVVGAELIGILGTSAAG